ncbi:hypothetical protein [Flavivirga jejuensis]|uniref:Lipoprotein n=2 Tax=Flavivirga jejuensis TaxID=870487 RepID=A0ABT8WUG2_9FLAO|nr:hypothetical protein [Flavivirga jejuensis]
MKYVFYIYTTIALFSCRRGYEVTELYEQPINNSSLSLLEYQAWSTLNDGSIYGYTLKDSSEIINIVEAKQIPFRYLTEIPSTDTIHTVEFVKGGNRIPEFESTEISSINGIKIVTDRYKYSIGTSFNLSYRFNDFEERNDSLIIKGIELEHFNVPVDGSEIGFRKGNIKLEESKGNIGVLKSIKIPAILVRDYIGGSIDRITIKRNDSLKINGLVFFKFVPIKEIKIEAFSNNGVYKKKRVLDKHKI